MAWPLIALGIGASLTVLGHIANVNAIRKQAKDEKMLEQTNYNIDAGNEKNLFRRQLHEFMANPRGSLLQSPSFYNMYINNNKDFDEKMNMKLSQHLFKLKNISSKKKSLITQATISTIGTLAMIGIQGYSSYQSNLAAKRGLGTSLGSGYGNSGLYNTPYSNYKFKTYTDSSFSNPLGYE